MDVFLSLKKMLLNVCMSGDARKKKSDIDGVKNVLKKEG